MSISMNFRCMYNNRDRGRNSSRKLIYNEEIIGNSGDQRVHPTKQMKGCWTYFLVRYHSNDHRQGFC